jgi:hypothetical protein
MFSKKDDSPYYVYPPGHYYSTIPDIDQIKKNEKNIFKKNGDIPGIDLNVNGQLALLHQLKKYYSELPFQEEKNDKLRYYFNNDFFSYGDGIILYSMIRHLKPKRIIEVGSGFSSCIFLDMNEFFFNNSISCSFIEPYPDRLLSLIKNDDLKNIDLKKYKLEDIDKIFFQDLTSGDILFIDSSHVAKINSDVNYLFFEILPLLKSGVYVHFHDIFFPFEYPKDWIYDGRFWNEAYLLRAFLEFNDVFRIMFFNSFMYQTNKDELSKNMPLFCKNPGGSLWMTRL